MVNMQAVIKIVLDFYRSAGLSRDDVITVELTPTYGLRIEGCVITIKYYVRSGEEKKQKEINLLYTPDNPKIV